MVWPTLYIYGVHTVFLAWKSPNIRCIYTYIYGSGQRYACAFAASPSAAFFSLIVRSLRL